jgi:hypothetical protein
MNRLCGRPGCSEPASVAYGMRAEDLVFWIDVLIDGADLGGVLCRRHADSMVVPRGWTLDDLRDPDLHLFRPPEPTEQTEQARSRQPRQRRHSEAPAEQLELVTESPPLAEPEPWTPMFDEADDLDGLLSARSPLLARAFRQADRPRPT